MNSSPAILDEKYNEVLLAINRNEMAANVVLLIGKHGTGKTQVLSRLASNNGYQLFNVGQSLSKSLLSYSKEERPTQVEALLDEACSSKAVLLLDNTEILFHPDLKQNVMRLLKTIGRKRKYPIVVSIAGSIQHGSLLYSASPFTDSKKYDIHEFLSVCMGD